MKSLTLPTLIDYTSFWDHIAYTSRDFTFKRAFIISIIILGYAHIFLNFDCLIPNVHDIYMFFEKKCSNILI